MYILSKKEKNKKERGKKMKNLFKYLSVAALVGSIGFSTMGVNAATNLTSISGELTCAPNEKIKRDYLMFLDSNTKGFYTNLGTSTKPYRTSGVKYNQVKQGTSEDKIRTGSINVVDEDHTKTTGDASNVEPWTAQKYWTNYALAVNHKNTNLVFIDGDESYILHSGWTTYNDETDEEVKYTEENTTANDKLNTYLKNQDNIEKIAKNGTAYPKTSSLGPNLKTSLGASSAPRQVEWKVRREYKASLADGVDGVAIEGLTGNRIYSPFVVYVEYCEANGGSTSDPEANKELKYVKNIDAEVTDMPTDETFEDKTKVSTSVPKATGYRFLGWSTKKEDTTADEKYKAGSEISESTTLYAIWQKSDGTFTVTYDANGGKNAPAKDSAKDGSCLKISDKKPTQTGFNFLGWSTKKDAQEPDKKYAAGADYCGDAGNVTLYAVWQTRTGVSAHLIAFGTVALAAVGALVVAKKKNLFRQI